MVRKVILVYEFITPVIASYTSITIKFLINQKKYSKQDLDKIKIKEPGE